MADHDIGVETLLEALLQQEFTKTDEFGLFVTYERANDPLKIHVGPDGSFAAFDSYDQLVAEGSGTRDLYAILVSNVASTRRSVSTRQLRSGPCNEIVRADGE